MLLGVILASIFCLASAADDEVVSIAGFVRALSQEHGFQVEGLSVVGNDSFVPSSRKRPDVEKSLARALSRYNYVVNYGEKRIVRVVVLSRKGRDTGPMPEDVAAEPPQPVAVQRDEDE